jgi:hypothetical protein
MEDGLLSCTRMRLQKQAESVTGRTLSLLSADVLSKSVRTFTFASPRHTRLFCLREDCGQPVLRPCLPLRFPRRPLMSITRDPPAHQLGRGLSSPSGNSVMRCTPPLCMSLPCIGLPPSSVVGHALASASPRHICTCPSRAHPGPAPTSQAQLHFSRG